MPFLPPEIVQLVVSAAARAAVRDADRCDLLSLRLVNKAAHASVGEAANVLAKETVAALRHASETGDLTAARRAAMCPLQVALWQEHSAQLLLLRCRGRRNWREVPPTLAARLFARAHVAEEGVAEFPIQGPLTWSSAMRANEGHAPDRRICLEY
jgi:hypothetical protein